MTADHECATSERWDTGANRVLLSDADPRQSPRTLCDVPDAIAGGLAAAGVVAPWHRSGGWRPIAAALSNVGRSRSSGRSPRAIGLPLDVVFGWNGGGMKRDLPLL